MQVLPYPTAVIYQAAPGVTETGKSQLVGRIEARGTYRFPLTAGTDNAIHFFLYDFIKEELIDTIDFSIPSKPRSLP